MSEELVAARKATFTIGAGWPHEGKRGWKCKIAKLVEAGWCFDPNPTEAGMEENEELDGVSCFYCGLSLDGWEPKDDPLEEHRRRSTDCAFFALLERFGGNTDGKKTKAKAKSGKTARASTASKASRVSTQSVLSAASEPASLVDLGPDTEAAEAAPDDSIVSTASQATVTGTAKGKKKSAKPKAAAKGAKGRKRANTVESEAGSEPLYPDLSSHATTNPSQHESEATAVSQPGTTAEKGGPQAKKTRKGTRQSKQPRLDSSIVEIGSLDIAPPKKTTRGRKAKTQPQSQPEPEVDAEADLDNSEVSAQLQEELERSMDWDAGIENVPAISQTQPAAAKRGVKRTSNGLRKQKESEDISGVIEEFPAPPAQAAPPAKAKRGRKPSKQTQEEDAPWSESEAETAKSTKPKKATAKKGAKGRKASSTRSSKATITTEFTSTQNEPEDLERDEREIEAELQRIANEQQALQVQVEQEKVIEFEPSPHMKKHVKQIVHLEEELRAEVENLEVAEGENMANYVASVAVASPPAPPVPPKEEYSSSSPRSKNQDPATTRQAAEQIAPAAIPGGWPVLPTTATENDTPSPSGSDKENQPSAKVHLSLKKSAPVPCLSPTKTTRVPLASGTPNRLSPSKHEKQLLLSPSKSLSQLTSSRPWVPVDIDSLLSSSQTDTPGTLAQRLAGAAGGVLTSPEKQLTVEEWVKIRARKGEEDLRRGCEEMVAVFEKEGLRALESLNGIVVVGGS